MKTLYKAHVVFTDEYGNFKVRYQEHQCHRESKSYYYINISDYRIGARERRVDKDAPNAFAFDTKEKALLNLLKRRERRQALLEWSLRSNERVVAELYKMNGIKQPFPELKYQYL